MAKKIISVAACLLLSTLLLIFAGHLVRPAKVDTDIRAIETFLEMPADSFEVICYGSSHVYWSLDILEMYNRHGIGAYNYGNDGQHINTTLLFLKDSLRTQHPRIAVIETFRVSDILQNTNLERETYYTRTLPESSYRREYLRQCFGNSTERWISYYLPIFSLHENWTSINEDSFKRNSSTVDFTKTMGYLNIGNEAEEGLNVIPGITPQLPLPNESVKILDEIVETADDNGIQLVFYTAPFHGWYAYSDAMAEYAETRCIPYINLFEEFEAAGFDAATDFHDKNHINANGAIKVADYIGAFLKDNYDLTDFRTIPNNLWEQAQK